MNRYTASQSGRVLTVICATVMASACHTPVSSVVPGGSAGYEALSNSTAAEAEKSVLLASGDQVAVSVYEEPTLSTEGAVIDSAGNIALPLIGEISAKGKTTSQLAEDIRAAYAVNIIRDPRVLVQLKAHRNSTVAVEGEVELPGAFEYEEGMTLLGAIARARSTTDTAKLDEIAVFRTVEGQRLAGRFDLKAIRAGRMPDVPLVPGDIVVVGFSASRAALLDFFRTVPLLGYFRPYP